jgi:hypothetical protein
MASSDWTEEEQIEYYEERAAILEFDGGWDREEAQRRAYWEWRRRFAGIAAPQKLRDWFGSYTTQTQLFETHPTEIE